MVSGAVHLHTEERCTPLRICSNQLRPVLGLQTSNTSVWHNLRAHCRLSSPLIIGWRRSRPLLTSPFGRVLSWRATSAVTVIKG